MSQIMDLLPAVFLLPFVLPKIKKRYPDKSEVFYFATSGVICLVLLKVVLVMVYILVAFFKGVAAS